MDHEDFVLVERQDSEQGDENAPIVTPEDLDKIRSWLSPTEFESEGSEYCKHLNAHVPGTGDWLFQTGQYKNWHDNGIGALWIQGIPGSGKSVVAANLIQTLRKEGVPVLFFFSRRIIKSNSEPRYLVRDCLYQFLDHSVALQARLKRVVEQHPLVWNVPFHELWRILLSALSTVPKVCVLFDALDEHAVEEDNFLECLLELGQKRPDSIKLIMTSRPLAHLQMVLKGPFLASIRLSGSRVERDIATYITHRIANQQERSLTTEDQSAIRDILCQKGQGLFLYARLMLDELLQQSSPISTHLQHLPTSLEDMYVDLLHEHSSRSGASLHFQSSLLSWVTHASRPLRVTELAALINSHGDRGGLNDFQDAKLMARTSCGPLLEILDDETVQVIHHSFTEFLLDSNRNSAKETSKSKKWFPSLTLAIVHRSLTLSCIDYLQSGCFMSWSVEERPTMIDYENSRRLEKYRHLMIRFHFLQYASQNLLYHAVKCDTLDTDLASKFDGFFQYGSHDFESWKDCLFSREDKPTPDDFYPLHMAAQAGLTAYTVRLLEKGENPDLVDSQKRTATAYAAMNGHTETLVALINKKASFTINDWDGLAPIHHATKGNHVKALRFLLDVGADPMSPKSDEDNGHYSVHPSTFGQTPIQLACELGSADAVTELLQHLESPLKNAILPHWAAASGQAKVLSILLQHPEISANINKKDVSGNTALFLGACARDSATVRILLQHGADVHLRSDDLINSLDRPVDLKTAKSKLGRTPLQGWSNRRRGDHNEHQSSVEEWEKAGTMLIEAGCDVEATDEDGKPPLFSWIEQISYGRGDSDRTARFVSLLLKYGANPRMTDNKGNTALHFHQMWCQDPKIIGLFTNGGADINALRESDLVTPLIAAAKAQCVDVRSYIKNGADPNMQDSDGNTALHHISRSWLFELSHVKEWLSFADPTIKNKKGETCLYNLRFGNGGDGRVQAIPLLVETGLELESRNRLGRTALLAACANAEPHFISGLVRYGADVKSKDFQNKSCLHLVAKVELSNYDHGPKDIQTTSNVIKTLIQAGADINDTDFNGNTPFLDAVDSSGHFPTLKIRLELILKFGGKADVSNHRGETALHKVARLRNSDPGHYAHTGVADRIDFLLQQSLGLDLHARNNEGTMAIHIAASTSDINTWKFAQAGADLQAQAYDGRNPLHFAAGEAQSNVVGLLCRLYREKSWTVDQKDERGRTALHYSALSGNSECVYYLVQFGANPNIKDNEGLTPLHLAAEHQIDTTNLRKQRKDEKLAYWKDVSSGMKSLFPYMDTRKDSPFYNVKWNLSVAIRQEEEARMIQDVVLLLLSAGADPALLDNSGQTACDVAVFLNNEDLVDAISPLKQKADAQNLLADQLHSIRTMSVEKTVRNINFESADPSTLLQTAIGLRNEVVLEALLKAGVDPTALGPDALAPVHMIAHFGLISMMKIVASHVKDLNVFSPPLLHVAASRELSNIQMIDLLIELGVNVNAPYQEVDGERRRSTGASIPSYTAAHILAMGEQWWNIPALESLCKAGADLEVTDGDGHTVLQCALNGRKSGSWGLGFFRDETLQVLLRHGANINALSPNSGSTPLIACLESKRGPKLVQKLLDCGADINLGEVPAIFVAIESEDPEVVTAVLDAGANVNAVYYPQRAKKWGKGPKVETPLLAAAVKDGLAIRETKSDKETRKARIAILAVLLERGADPLMELEDGGTTVLHQIAYYHGLIAPILKTGVKFEIKDCQGQTPLLLACSPVDKSYRGTEDESTPRELILAGADINATDNTGSTPLQLAAQSGLLETVTLLLEKGASLSATNNAGLSPLFYALSHPYYQTKLKLTKTLLDAGAELLITGPNGETPLHLLSPSLMQLSPADGAEYQERIYQRDDKMNYLAEFNSLYQRFIDSGCDRNARDYLGNTPLFPYVKNIKYRSDYVCVEAPAEEDVRKMFENHHILAVNDEGDTLLHAVAGRNEGYESESDGLWLFKELMARGLDPRRENKKGVSALDIAAACGKDAILGVFVREE